MRQLFPEVWLDLFGSDLEMLETGIAYLTHVGPTYGFFELGLSLYFASQGAGRLAWPLIAGMVRMILALLGGWAILRATGSLDWTFAVLGLALLAYGTMIAGAIASGVRFEGRARR